MYTKLFIFFQYVLPKKILSRLTGFLAEQETVWLKNKLISAFVKRYEVNLSEAEYSDINHYRNFNDFFTRQLQEGARKIDSDPSIISSPCDGVISQVGDIDFHQLIQAKGKYYTLQDLLAGDETLCDKFTNGTFATCYLSPKDYHRVHMPIDGTLLQTIYVPGTLFSVNGTTAQNIPNLFARNERLICEFDTAIGPVISIMVGATIVAGIDTVWAGQVAPPPKTISTRDYKSQPDITLKKGDEMGQFKLGSTVILLFPENAVTFSDSLHEGSELHLGNAIASINVSA